MNAREIVDEALRLVLAHDMAGFADLWAEDGVLEFPFATPDRQRRLVGRHAVRDHLRDYTDHVAPEEVTALTVHLTTDPEVVVAEFEITGRLVPTGADYRMGYIAVVTARDGEITRYRDYWSPAAAGEIGFGGGAAA
ncbi:nuclear transport factor 2 family protein [Saccharothrix lopnurensis]|uniref:Nuclear transport factor 2 family protein n=1 Tax=Saccharothrix lopnurensis TaxID=1670621 RepID=A0ABW1NX03_9PSEU